MFDESEEPPQLAKSASDPIRTMRPMYFPIWEVWQAPITAEVLVPFP